MTAVDLKIRVFTAHGRRDVAPDHLPEVLAGLAGPGCPTTWIHAEPQAAVIQALDDMGLDEIAVKSLRDGPERPRVEEFADHLYISLFSAEAPAADGAGPLPRGEPVEAGHVLPHLHELRLFLGPRWLISVGHLDEADLEILADRMNRQVFSRDRGPSFIAYHICEWLVESLQPFLDRLDDRIDALEDQVVVATGEGAMQELFSLKRDLVDLRRRVAPLRDVMQRLGSHGVLYVEEESEVYFRDVHDDIMRDIELLDTYRDILSSALDLHLSSVSNRLNRIMNQLTVVATIFLPLSFVVGFFGMNFTAIPFRSSALLVIMFILLLVSVVSVVVYARRRA
jgi:magnesium transporter